MNLALIRSLVTWATLSCALLAVIYAPKQLMVWSNESRAWETPNPSEGLYRQKRGIATTFRDFLWIDQRVHPYMTYSRQKYITDWNRIAGELIVVIGIGGGLRFALREKRLR